MQAIPDTDGAKVLIALGGAATLFALILITAIDPTLVARKWIVYTLLGLVGAMLGVDHLTG